ncbi:DUF6862 domain-containing protein [Budvicia aquatica]|uniref:DUF6862 domain-containing protein n=1 Tax=Budvicia aquatica TaxID=82979 RepID=A0A2C6C3I2_9GAMM|nr:hypothetical protein [Budvicia aquatica]PHI30900.1 hypothetical protein CRN84_16925 [Budvicia aquatica]VFS50805.1 Uncharacterised protein [Budvicia aquatica]
MENNSLSANEKSELEIAKLKLNSNDPTEREKAQQKVAELTELDISRDQKVIDACGNGNAGSAGCASARLEAIANKNSYETGPYNSQLSKQYADAYGQIVNLLNSTTEDAQHQQQVTEGLTQYFMAATGADYETAKGYAQTKQGADIIIASVALGANLQAVNSYLVSKGAFASEATSVSGKLPFNIKSMQVGLRDPAQVELIKNDMINGNFRYTAPEGRIAGYVDSKGNYYISEGNHRMARSARNF